MRFDTRGLVIFALAAIMATGCKDKGPNPSPCNCAANSRIYASDSSARFVFPTAFTPNGDGHNDRFSPILLQGDTVTGYSYKVISGSGATLFSTTSLQEGWDGNKQGTSQRQPNNIYYFLLQFTTSTNQIVDTCACFSLQWYDPSQCVEAKDETFGDQFDTTTGLLSFPTNEKICP
jgi:gliding motility-associated-like protein